MNEMLEQKIRYRNAVARAHSQVISGQSATVMVKEAPRYTGRAFQLLPIVLANLALTLLTAGLYRFWAKTRIRRYFLSRISFLGDPLEYTGTGAELFKGFLIVLAILVPFLFLTGLVQQFVAAPGAHPMNAAIFQATYILSIYFLYSVAVYRAQRYRLSRTSWRGIRGGQQGSALLYAAHAMGLGIATLVTAGLAYPAMRRLLVGYRIRHACFGTETFQFGGGIARLFAAWLVPWHLMAAIVALIGHVLWQQDLDVLAQAEPAAMPTLLAPILSRELYAALALIPVFVVALIWYRAFETRQWINNTRFGQLEFASRLRAIHIIAPYLAYGIALLVVNAAIFAGFGFAMARRGSFDPTILGFGVIAAIWLFASVLNPLIIQNWLFRNICKTSSLQGSFSPDRLFQNQLDIPRRGEGLADALDVDAF